MSNHTGPDRNNPLRTSDAPSHEPAPQARRPVRTRLDLKRTNPLGMALVMAMDRYCKHTMPAGLHELVCLRASVQNQCHYCIAVHTRALKDQNETPQRIHAAREPLPSPAYTNRENAALALTDAVTHLGSGGIPDPIWDQAARNFSRAELGRLVLTITTINVWNRIAITTRPRH